MPNQNSPSSAVTCKPAFQRQPEVFAWRFHVFCNLLIRRSRYACGIQTPDAGDHAVPKIVRYCAEIGLQAPDAAKALPVENRLFLIKL